MIALGIDTSNYATSLAVFDSGINRILFNERTLLAVKSGQLGLRQQDAVFAHIKNLQTMFDRYRAVLGSLQIDRVGVSDRPRDAEGSYMPCFLAGSAVATAFSTAIRAPLIKVSHQAGHVLAALFGSDFDVSIDRAFWALHISGGTTDILRCELKNHRLSVFCAATSLDLYAGQLVDRVGKLLGCGFPAGPELSRLASLSDREEYAKPVLRDGNACLSGLENQCGKYYQNHGKEDTARYCLLSVGALLEKMLRYALKNEPETDLVFAGGVLSSSVIREQLGRLFPNGHFCEPPSLSSDNAVGVAILAALTEDLS